MSIKICQLILNNICNTTVNFDWSASGLTSWVQLKLKRSLGSLTLGGFGSVLLKLIELGYKQTGTRDKLSLQLALHKGIIWFKLKTKSTMKHTLGQAYFSVRCQLSI